MLITKRDITESTDEALVDLLEIAGANVGQAISQCKNPSKQLEKQLDWIKDEILRRMREGRPET